MISEVLKNNSTLIKLNLGGVEKIKKERIEWNERIIKKKEKKINKKGEIIKK